MDRNLRPDKVLRLGLTLLELARDLLGLLDDDKKRDTISGACTVRQRVGTDDART